MCACLAAGWSQDGWNLSNTDVFGHSVPEHSIGNKCLILDSLCRALELFNNKLELMLPLGRRIPNRCPVDQTILQRGPHWTGNHFYNLWIHFHSPTPRYLSCSAIVRIWILLASGFTDKKSFKLNQAGSELQTFPDTWISVHKTLREAQVCELSMHTGQGSRCVSDKLLHVTQKDHNTTLPPRQPSEHFRQKKRPRCNSFLQALGHSLQYENCDRALWMCNMSTMFLGSRR